MIVLKRTIAIGVAGLAGVAAYATQNAWVGVAVLAVAAGVAIFVGRKWGF